MDNKRRRLLPRELFSGTVAETEQEEVLDARRRREEDDLMSVWFNIFYGYDVFGIES